MRRARAERRRTRGRSRHGRRQGTSLRHHLAHPARVRTAQLLWRDALHGRHVGGGHVTARARGVPDGEADHVTGARGGDQSRRAGLTVAVHEDQRGKHGSVEET